MKILYHHRIASKDGQYVHIEELTHALKELGHEIIMIGPAIVEKDAFGSRGRFVTSLKRYLPGFIYELLELLYSVIAYIKLRKAVRKYQPDFLYERYNLFMLAGVWIKHKYGIPLILEINAPLYEERRRYNGIALPDMARWSEEYIWNGADVVLPVTHVLAKKVMEAGVPSEKIEVIPNGINRQRFDIGDDVISAKRMLGLEENLVLGFTGFMRDWHGLERVVDVLVSENGGMKKHLLLVGDGPARAAIERRARELGVHDKVTITGIVSREKVAGYISAFDIALQPDVVEYASPLKLFEYMALGCAIIAPATENIKEILTDNVNALLFDSGKTEELYKCIRTLCSDRQLRLRLGRCAKLTISERNLTWEGNARKVISQAERLVS